mmetsp:Transcript_18901/g.45322  ORF Transcript_18901/g.45322 Transcript_18901/m.45322 type:complete len:810 (-) Transcript_18901:52-2481(-)
MVSLRDRRQRHHGSALVHALVDHQARDGQGLRYGRRIFQLGGELLPIVGLVRIDGELRRLEPRLLRRVPHRPRRGDLLRHVRQRTHLQPPLAECLLGALAHVPVRREEPDHPRRVGQLLVADAVVDQLAVAQHVCAQLVLVPLLGCRAAQAEARAHVLRAVHCFRAVPRAPISNLPHVLDVLRHARGVDVAPVPRVLAEGAGGANPPPARSLPQHHVVVPPLVHGVPIRLLPAQPPEGAELILVDGARCRHGALDVHSLVAHRGHLHVLRRDPPLVALVPDLPHPHDLLGERRRVAHLHPPRLLPQLVALAHVPVAVGSPHHVGDRRVLLVHRLAVHLGRRDHTELTHLVSVQPVDRRAQHLDGPRADGSALHVGRGVQLLAVAHTPRRLDELRRGRGVTHAQPALALAELVLLAEVPVASGVPKHAVVVADLRVDGAAVHFLAEAADELSQLVVVQIVGRVPRHHHRRRPHRHAPHLRGIHHLLAIAHTPDRLDQLWARGVVLAAQPALRLAHVLRLAEVPVRRRVPDAPRGCVHTLVHRAAIVEPVALPRVLAQLVFVHALWGAARKGDPLGADGDRLQLARLLPLLVRAVPHLPVGDAFGRDGFGDCLVPPAVLPKLVTLADVPRAAGRVPHHDVRHAHHLIDAALRDHAQLHAAVLAQLILEKVVRRGAMDDHASCRRDGDALDVARLLPLLLRAAPHRPMPLDVLREQRVRPHLQPPPRLSILFLLADIPRRLVIIIRIREPHHVVGVVVLLVRRPSVFLAAGADVLPQLILVDGHVVDEWRLPGDEDTAHIFDDRRPHRTNAA